MSADEGSDDSDPSRDNPSFTCFRTVAEKSATLPSPRWPTLASALHPAGPVAADYYVGNQTNVARSGAEPHPWLKSASTWEEWRAQAEKLDILEGNHFWKMEDDSPEYRADLLTAHLGLLKQAHRNADVEVMLEYVRDHMKRDLAGMYSPQLYRHSYVGTKCLIDEYTEVVKYTLERLVRHCELHPNVDLHRYIAIFEGAIESFGHSALMLSGGGTLGMCHIGVVKTLLEQNLLPDIVCGSSAGSIVGSVLCSYKRSEIGAKLDDLQNGELGDLQVFQGEHELQGVLGAVVNMCKGEPAFQITNLCRVMRGLLGDLTFKEAYNLTQMVLNIHVSSKDKFRPPRLLNYVATPNVVIWTAVASSCALPLVFNPPGLWCKDAVTGKIMPWGPPDHRYIDGSIAGDLPSPIIERLFNVNNFIACQVNPHAQPWIQKVEGEAPRFVRRGITRLKDASVCVLDTMMEAGYDYFPIQMAHSVISQKYDGDITILPDISSIHPLQILANPTREFMKKATRYGERATWPKLDRIRNAVAIELALKQALNDLKVVRVMRAVDPHARTRRPTSSTRSERGHRPRQRTRSGGLGYGSGSSSFTARSLRGRRVMYLPLKPPGTASTFAPLPIIKLAGDHPTSSSDEKGSGHSTCTSYEDEDFDDVTLRRRDPDRARLTQPAGGLDRERVRAFLSQPVSPSISFTSFFGSDTAAAAAAAAAPPPPASPELRRALNGLQMSTLDASPSSAERKRSRG